MHDTEIKWDIDKVILAPGRALALIQHYKKREQELLEANNRYLERARAAEAQHPTPSSHVNGLQITEWERTRLSQFASSNALTYMGHHAHGGLKPDEVEEMERWSALSDKLRALATEGK